MLFVRVTRDGRTSEGGTSTTLGPRAGYQERELKAYRKKSVCPYQDADKKSAETHLQGPALCQGGVHARVVQHRHGVGRARPRAHKQELRVRRQDLEVRQPHILRNGGGGGGGGSIMVSARRLRCLYLFAHNDVSRLHQRARTYLAHAKELELGVDYQIIRLSLGGKSYQDVAWKAGVSTAQNHADMPM